MSAIELSAQEVGRAMPVFEGGGNIQSQVDSNARLNL